MKSVDAYKSAAQKARDAGNLMAEVKALGSAACRARKVVSKCSKQGDLAAERAARTAEAKMREASADLYKRLAEKHKAEGDPEREANALGSAAHALGWAADDYTKLGDPAAEKEACTARAKMREVEADALKRLAKKHKADGDLEKEVSALGSAVYEFHWAANTYKKLGDLAAEKVALTASAKMYEAEADAYTRLAKEHKAAGDLKKEADALDSAACAQPHSKCLQQPRRSSSRG
jgi:hypothetical protein